MTKLIAEMTTAEMVAEYNTLTGKSIKKFSSRAAGEKQLAAARAANQPEMEETVNEQSWKDLNWEQKLALWKSERRCPHCGDKDNGVTAAGEEGTVAGENRSFCHICSTEFDNETGKVYNAPAKSVTRSKAISESWADKKIAEKRARRDNVAVKGVGTFRSVCEAFKKLNLPLNQHIKFRMTVKTDGTGVFKTGDKEYHFTLVEQKKLDV